MNALKQIDLIEQNKINALNSDSLRLAFLNIACDIRNGNMTSDMLYEKFDEVCLEDEDAQCIFEIERDLRLAQKDLEHEKKQFAKRVHDNKNRFLFLNSKYENLKFDDLNKIDKKILDYAQKYCDEFNSRFKPFGVHMILSGNRGIGKTCLAATICLTLIERHGIRCSFVNLSHYLNEMQNFDKKDKSLNEILDSDLVLIDDYGMTRKSEFAVEQIYMLVDEIYRRNIPIIVTTNSSKNYLLNDNSMFGATTSRILDNSIFLEMEGCDIRKSRVYDPEKVFGA